MKTTQRFVLFLLLVVTGLTSVAQNVPGLINYQGRLSNPDGSFLATSNYTLSFKVYDTAINGNSVWGPQVFDGSAVVGHGAQVAVVNGYFNVMLGPVDITNNSLAGAFTSTNRFVEITIGNGTPISPRQQILTTPYAFQALNASNAANSATLSGYNWSALFGTNDPVNGKLPVTRLATNGSLVAQQIGVGTSSPLASLDVLGDVRIRADRDYSSQSGALRVGRADNPSKFLYMGYDSGDFGYLQTINAAVAFKNLCLNPYAGNVGIATTSPGYKLTVNVASSSSDGIFASSADSHFLGVFPSLGGGSYNPLASSGDAGIIFSGVSAGTGNLVIGPYSASSAGIKILSNGRVGIGTGNPSAALDVIGDSPFTPIVSIGGGTSINGTAMELGNSGWTNTPALIDFHYGVINSNEDFNMRIINDMDGRLSFYRRNDYTALLIVTNGGIYAKTTFYTSDRNSKTNFESLDPADILERLTKISVSKWNYKGDSAIKHVGPMAQDFFTSFGVGVDDKHISDVDMNGVMFAAIQGLNQKLEEKLQQKESEIAELKSKLSKLDALEARLNQLEIKSRNQSSRN